MVCFNTSSFVDAILKDDGDAIKNQLLALDESERIGAVQSAVEGTNSFCIALCDRTLSVFNAIFDTVPPSDHVKVLLIKNRKQDTILNYAMCGYDQTFADLLSRLPKTEALMQVFDEEPGQSCPLRESLRMEAFNITKALLSILSPTRHKEIIRSTCSSGWTPLHWAANNGNPEIIQLMLDPIPSSERFEFQMIQDKMGRLPLRIATRTGKAAAVNSFFGEMAEEKIEELMHLKCASGITTLESAVASESPTLLHLIMSKMPSTVMETATKIQQLLRCRPFVSLEKLKNMSQTLTMGLPLITPDVFVKRFHRGDSERLHLYEKNPSALVQSYNLIKDYAFLVDPARCFKMIKIKPVTDEDAFEMGYTCYASIRSTLPTPLRIAYGSKPKKWKYSTANCHGAAAFALRLRRQISLVDCYEHLTGILHKGALRVALETLTTGDYVLLTRPPVESHLGGWQGAHSFVYLSGSMCISMNGINKSLELFSTPFVLAKYGYPSNALEKALPGEEEPAWKEYIEVYRKKTVDPVF